MKKSLMASTAIVLATLLAPQAYADDAKMQAWQQLFNAIKPAMSDENAKGIQEQIDMQKAVDSAQKTIECAKRGQTC